MHTLVELTSQLKAFIAAICNNPVDEKGEWTNLRVGVVVIYIITLALG